MAESADSGSTNTNLLPPGKVAVIGNGYADPNPPQGCVLRFRFNAEAGDLDPNLDVNVRMVSGDDAPGHLKLYRLNEGSRLSALERRLNLDLEQQTRNLGCLPSTGYALIHGLWAFGSLLQISGVGFDPSLVRPHDLGTRKPLPQAFHNWLGERRTTFRRWLDCPPNTWKWRLVTEGQFVAAPIPTNTSAADGVHYLDVLDCVRATARTGQLADFARLGRKSILPTPDLLRPHPLIKELENGFYLDRHQNSTPNWWLFDAEASELAEAIASNIRQAQHQAFFHEIALNPAGCQR